MLNRVIITAIFLASSMHIMAQTHLDLVSLCEGKSQDAKSSFKMQALDGRPMVVIDNGFCDEYLSNESVVNMIDDLVQSQEFCPINEIKLKDKWKIRFYASHSFTQYFNTDVYFRSTRYNIEIKDYEWAERSSREFFLPKTWKEKGNNPFQVIDEPTNTFVVSIEKEGHEFFLSAFHPKFLQKENQVKQITGTIDGVEINEVTEVNKAFDGYDQTPGESEIVRNQNTHKEMIFEFGYGHRFKLLDSKRLKIDYIPSVAVGVVVGQNYSVVIQEGKWWDNENALDHFKIQGVGGSITNRVEFNTPKERFGVFYENKLGLYKMEHGFLDGTQKYNLALMGNSVGVKFMIYNPNNHKKKYVSADPLF